MAIGDDHKAPPLPSSKKAAAPDSMEDATGVMPIANQTVALNSVQQEKLIMQIDLPLKVKSKKQIHFKVTPNGEYLRLVYPRPEFSTSDQKQFFDFLSQASLLRVDDLVLFKTAMESEMKKKRASIQDTIYEVCYIKLVKPVDPLAKPISQIMCKRGDSNALLVVLHVPSDNAYDTEEEDKPMVF